MIYLGNYEFAKPRREQLTKFNYSKEEKKKISRDTVFYIYLDIWKSFLFFSRWWKQGVF